MVSSPVNVAEARSGSNFKSYESGTTLSGSLCARIPELANRPQSASTTTRFINVPFEFAARARGIQLRRRTRPENCFLARPREATPQLLSKVAVMRCKRIAGNPPELYSRFVTAQTPQFRRQVFAQTAAGRSNDSFEPLTAQSGRASRNSRCQAFWERVWCPSM